MVISVVANLYNMDTCNLTSLPNMHARRQGQIIFINGPHAGHLKQGNQCNLLQKMRFKMLKQSGN